MTDSLEWQGTWFINMPNGIEITFRGILSYNPSDGCILKASTDEQYSEFLDFVYESNKIEIINGYDNIYHKALLLKKCIIIQANQSNGISIKAVVTEIITNAIYENSNSLQYDKSIVEYSALVDWLNYDNKHTKFNHEDDPSIAFSFTYRQPEKLIFNINNDFDIKFIHAFSMAKKDENRIGNYFTERCNIHVISKLGRTSTKLLDKFSEHLRRLLAILYNQYCFTITHCYAIKEEFTTYDKYYRQKGIEIPNNYPSYGNILVKYKEIENIAERVFKKWFTYLDSNDLVYVAYITSKAINSFSEEVFLENVRAMEVYHKARNKGKYYFRDRITSIITQIQNIANSEDFNRIFPDTNRFIHLVVENRNYLTHYGDGSISSEDELEIEELFWLTKQCRILLIICIYIDLGIDSSKYFSKLAQINRKISK